MPNYQLSKIYAIRGGDEVYIGSSAQKYLSSRFEGHKKSYKCFKAGKKYFLTSFILFDKYGIENCFIELIEAFPCNSVEELRKREGEHIRKAQNCVNKHVAGRSDKEYYEEHKEKIKEKHRDYREEHKEATKEQEKKYRAEHKEQKKEWSKANKEEIKKYNKEWREENIEAIKERKKEYYEANKEQINEKKKVIYTCVCGSELRLSDKTRHERSKKHTAFINQNTITE